MALESAFVAQFALRLIKKTGKVRVHLQPATFHTGESVRIWDARSGECLQTLDIGKELDNISFDPTGSYLHTDIGVIAIDAPPTSNVTPDRTEDQDPQYQGVGLSANGDWKGVAVRLPSRRRRTLLDASV